MFHPIASPTPSSVRYAFVRDQIVPMQDAVLNIQDLSIQRGYGAFDYFRIFKGHPLFLREYLDRFEHSIAVMRLSLPFDLLGLRNILEELMGKNRLPHSGMKMILTGGYSPDGYQLAEPNLLLIQAPLILPTPEVLQKGIKVITHPFAREIPEVKTINYSMGIWLLQKIQEHQAEDVLYHQGGHLTEFPRCNFFMVHRDGTVLTPAQGILKGITRKKVLELARQMGSAEEKVLTLEDLKDAQEAFLTSTTKGIVPIVQIDDAKIGTGQPGPVTQELLQRLTVLVQEAGM